MKKTILFIISFSFCAYTYSQNQGVANLWQSGYSSWAGLPFGGTDIDFDSGIPIITNKARKMNFSRNVDNISDSLGNLLFYTNGIWISDASDDTMQNGSNISPPVINDSLGLWVSQACLILPMPNHPEKYYLFHSSLDDPPNDTTTLYLKYSIIDMNLNNGKGSVISKNNIIINDTIVSGVLTGCKHGNGRDWWIVCFEKKTDAFYTMLLSPNGVSGPFIQHFGTKRVKGITQSVFSPDGNMLAFLTGSDTLNKYRIEIFDFDRCSGLFTNEHLVYVYDNPGIISGIAFSSNSQFIFVSTLFKLFQYNLTQTNIQSSEILIAQWDSTYSPNPPFAALFEKMLLAPDGRIYMNTGNSTFTMHVINNPDSLGVLCDFVQHAINFNTLSVSAPPNHPNYFLGRDTGSVCDTITVWMGSPPAPQKGEVRIQALPNPSDGEFTLWFPVDKNVGWLEIYNSNGELIRKEPVAQWSQYKQVDLRPLTPKGGMFFCKMRWKDGEGSLKVIKE